MKFMSWIIFPQVFQFKADSKPFPWATFAMERQEERCPLCHSLFFCQWSLPERPPATSACLFHWPFWESRALTMEAPTMTGLVSSEAQGLGTCLSGQKPTLVSCACHGTTIVFMVRISSSLVSVQRPKLGGKKSHPKKSSCNLWWKDVGKMPLSPNYPLC